ncbi:Druantia anti-phage system protein DruA [Halogeometricum sp. CBA1124]|uniref:Druantia anti-phage system protein DruA n=1 Tax=Halogeometricum sp. CBA1124 TaxID=2668071 RepID=UPI0018D270A7|nr:Druantia anti-phage system protein DruA [Halogeometricum sp. CBA1124]
MALNINEREVLYTPDLSPKFTRRFDALTDELVEYPKSLDREVAIKDEIKTVEQNLSGEELSEDRVRYLGILEVLLDLIEIGFEVRKNAEFKVVRPDLDRYKDDPEEYKEHERAILQKERITQFNEQSVRDFIRKMEGDYRTNGTGYVSVKNLITDGEDLYRSLAPLQDKPREEIVKELETEIQPYVQVAEKGEKCELTGLDLMNIWRYFRYTWLTPYNTVPGRNINFLIRDASREYHPVMGIASLASSMMNLSVRDEQIGWKIDALEDRLERKNRMHIYEEQLPKEERSHENQTREVKKDRMVGNRGRMAGARRPNLRRRA